MNRTTIAALSLSLFAGLASASNSASVDPVEVTADAGLSMACSSPSATDSELQALLGHHDGAQASYLQHGLQRAVSEACAQNIASIVVSRHGSQVDWAPASTDDNRVAIALR